MEKENKYYCPDCGTEMLAVYEKPALNLTCPNCGCKLATTKWETIDLDETIYEIETLSIKNPSLDQIKVFAKLTGNNFVASKDLIKKGYSVFKGLAKNLKNTAKILDAHSFKYKITPDYPYEIR